MFPSRRQEQFGSDFIKEFRKVWIDESIESQYKKDDDRKEELNSPFEYITFNWTLRDLKWHFFYWHNRFATIIRIHPLILMITTAAIIGWLIAFCVDPAIEYAIKTIRHRDCLGMLSAEDRDIVYQRAHDLIKTADNNQFQLEIFEELLVESMEPWCLKHMKLKIHGENLERFHFNFARLIKYAGREGSFEHYCDLKIMQDGRILDIHQMDSKDTLMSMESCPLLEAIFHVAESTNHGVSPKPGEDYFGYAYNWTELDDGLVWFRAVISPNGYCSSLGNQLTKKTTKDFMISALDTYAQAANDASLKNVWTRYMVDINSGEVKAVKNREEADNDMIWCSPLEQSLNSPHIWEGDNSWVKELASQTLRKLIDDEKLEEMDRRNN